MKDLSIKVHKTTSGSRFVDPMKVTRVLPMRLPRDCPQVVKIFKNKFFEFK